MARKKVKEEKNSARDNSTPYENQLWNFFWRNTMFGNTIEECTGGLMNKKSSLPDKNSNILHLDLLNKMMLEMVDIG
ncbi:hypothetical protein ZOSMA_42G00140 [Zostera marina]|uniref:Uncharacterized protein n=1 Tax=Zostera marina TaxID=29655 RepID=A0A0K9P1W7_ZOSMR|nr:hypothetical protein ZOSMA_42G00140 [Zostera marina]